MATSILKGDEWLSLRRANYGHRRPIGQAGFPVSRVRILDSSELVVLDDRLEGFDSARTGLSRHQLRAVDGFAWG